MRPIAKAMGWADATPADGAAAETLGGVPPGGGPMPSRGMGNAEDWPFSERECAQILAGVAEALLALHARGIAHRDIKPHNVSAEFGGRCGLLIRDARPPRYQLLRLVGFCERSALGDHGGHLAVER